MNQISDFPITQKWPPADPTTIQLYSWPTPNGIKISAMLEECGLQYEAHAVRFSDGDQKSPAFLSLNPNNKIPAIIDPDGPAGRPIALFESGAILQYLAEKTGQFLSADPETRWETLKWLNWQMGGVGPMFGQFGYFKRAGAADWDDTRAFDRYLAETKRLLGVLDRHLTDRAFMSGTSYSIADIALWPWLRPLSGLYDAADILELDRYAALGNWYTTCASRPASVRAIAIPSKE